MPLQGVLDGRIVAEALLGLDVQQHGAFGHLLPGFRERLHQGVHVMAVHGPQVAVAQLFEQQPGDRDALEGLLAPLGGLGQALADALQGDGLDGALDAVPPVVVVLAGDHLVQVALERAHVGVDAHVVVVEDHKELLGLQVAALVEPLEGHARRHGAVADHGDAGIVLLLEVPGLGHAQGGGDAGAGVTRPEVVVEALVPLLEAREAAVLAQGVEAALAAGEDLVGVGLVADVPDDPVLEEVEAVQQGDGELHRPEVGAEVSARLADGVDEELPHLPRELLQLGRREVADLLGRGDRVQERMGRGIGHQFARCAKYLAQAVREVGFGSDCN